MAAAYEDASDSDEEEEECRVCRGPAEEGRPLFKPCKCSGSIGLTHQDCLTSWLEVTRGDGKCELCSTRFQFAPEYAEGTPDRLSAREVGFRILRRLAARWLPRGLRALFAASLWLIVLPLSTSYIYHGWMHRPSAIAKRWSWELAKRDTVGGAVIAIIIVVSFLSLMSFAEFLRFQWGGAGQRPGAAGDRRGNRANNREGARGGPIEGDIDDIVVHHDDLDPLEPFLNRLRTGDEGSIDEDNEDDGEMHGGDAAEEEEKSMDGGEPDDNVHAINEVLVPLNADEPGGEGQDNEDPLQPAFDDEEDELEAFMREQEEQEMEDHHNNNVPAPPPPNPRRNPREDDALIDVPELARAGNRRPNRRPRDDARFEPQFEPLQPAFADLDGQDDGADVEINVALDELLGFRGPLFALVRNLLWLLVFNTAYLGVFAFAPSKFGGTMYAVLSKIAALRPTKASMPDAFAVAAKAWDGFVASMQELDRKSQEANLIYQPVQIAKMGLGYVSFSIGIFLMKSLVAFAIRSRAARTPTTPPGGQDNRMRGGGVQFRDEFRDDVALLRELERDEAQNERGNGSLARRLLGFLECAAAIAKVVILLFIKMLFLPLMLGIWLDLATLSLFEKSWSERIEYAGADLFGAVFVHWVAGITFMLLVTVSVLQLREVAHPDILSRVIRPQEPQPDLLGNLLQESGTTHTKRVLLSLGIYAALLAIHIWLPARLVLMSNMGKYMPLFKPKFWHFIMPQIQVPLELFIFHLCMLGVLEKYKNSIGAAQHHWLLLMGKYLGMTDQILPREVDRFSLVGTLPVFSEDATPNQMEIISSTTLGEGVERRNADLYPLWNYLLSENDSTKREEAIHTSIQCMDKAGSPQDMNGITRRNGKRVLTTHAYIRLPSASPNSRLVVKTSNDADSNLLPTAIGPYRLRQWICRTEGRTATNIEVWREVVGKPIPRPPEGWDDLGVGGAERHGRWAWGDEHLSEIENSVAVRTPFFEDPKATKWANAITLLQLAAKMAALLFVSWFAISVILCAVINIPLHTGHFALYLLRIPNDCLHDPFAFGMGILLLVPLAGTLFKLFAASNNGMCGVFYLILDWARSFKPHQTREKVKTLSTFFALWLFVCPALLGFVYCSFFVGSNGTGWFVGESVINWGTGTLLLNLWAIMCYYKMFTKRFWIDIVMGDGQGNAEGNQDADPAGAGQDGPNPARNAGMPDNDEPETDADVPKFTWQGEEGSIGRAVESVKAFASGWEWDKVDKQLLLQDCALLVSRHLAIWCAVPTATLAVTGPVINALGRQIGPTALFRTFTIASIVLDIANSSKKSLRRWFQAAHKIARDDAYLIGVRLQNFPQRSSSNS